MGKHRLTIGETRASSAEGADTLLSEKTTYSPAGTDKQGKTKIKLLCLVRDDCVFFRVG